MSVKEQVNVQVEMKDPPELGTKIPVEAPFVDERGVIQSVIEATTRSVALITSEPGAVRANHWHQQDWHYCYVISGSLDYFERPVGSTEKPSKTFIGPGELFFTPSGVEHAMVFREKTVFICLSRNPRDHATYEDDVKRVKLVEQA
jgi:quercetin dioxygenase-like cupin family protein